MTYAFIALCILYAAQTMVLLSMQKQINGLRKDLRVYFKKIDYQRLDFLIKKGDEGAN